MELFNKIRAKSKKLNDKLVLLVFFIYLCIQNLHMSPKYYPINQLQNDIASLGSVISYLDMNTLTRAEWMNMVENLKTFLCDLRSDLHVVIEGIYVDSVYRDSYYDYYSTKHSTYNRFCLRMSFFDRGFKNEIDFAEEKNIKDNYLGFLVIRPLIRCIGRNVISTKAKVSPKDEIRICKVKVDASCLGVKLKAEGFPHASQDNETMTCAQTTIWSLLEYYGNKYTYYHPTLPTEIESILEPFSYERQLPSKGLTYNQISVALRNLGFGPKIYQTGSSAHEVRHFHQLMACYIESGVPLAVALTNDKVGHAVVCIGIEKVDKHEVINHPVIVGSKTVYSWNDTVADAKFVFNDDNLPCYQVATLANPAKNYIDKGLVKWKNVKVSQFIAPLYHKVYMEADTAIALSEQIIGSVIPGGNGLVMRTLLTSSRTFREHITKISSLSNDHRLALLGIPMPKFVWVTELSTPDEFYNDKVSTLLLLDATGSKMANLSRNIILLLSDGFLYSYDNSSMAIVGKPTKLPKSFEAFPGNIY